MRRLRVERLFSEEAMTMSQVAQQVTGSVREWMSRHRSQSGQRPATSTAGLPTEVRVRRRRSHDVAACARLIGLVAGERGYPLPRPESYRHWLTDADVLDAWVAERHGEILGHVALTSLGTDNATAMRWREVTGRPPSELVGVSRFYVRARVRGSGIGTCLLDTAVAEARARGLTPVAETITTSRHGIPVFEDRGWRRLGMYPCGGRADGQRAYLYVLPG